MAEIPFKDLPLYSYDYDADFPRRRGHSRMRSPRSKPCCSLRRSTTARSQAGSKTPSTGRADPTARTRSPENRRRLSAPRRARSAPRWRSKAFAAFLPSATPADEHHRSLHPVQTRPDHRRWRGHRPLHRGVPARLHDAIPRLHYSGLYRHPDRSRFPPKQARRLHSHSAGYRTASRRQEPAPALEQLSIIGHREARLLPSDWRVGQCGAHQRSDAETGQGEGACQAPAAVHETGTYSASSRAI